LTIRNAPSVFPAHVPSSRRSLSSHRTIPVVWLVVTPNHQLWATDAHGRVKVFFVSTAELPFNLVKPLATISTGAHAVLVRKKYIRLSSMLFRGIN
jgi:hypothetical protein